MLRILAIMFGIGFIFTGVAGFLSTFVKDGLLFGYFAVDSVHNLFHIACGVLGIMAATNYKSTRFYFCGVGIIYALLAIVGFVFKGNMGFMTLHMNFADNLLCVVIAMATLYLGFSAKTRAA